MSQQGGQSQLRPHRYTLSYSLVLDAIAKSQKPSAAERAEAMLNAIVEFWKKKRTDRHCVLPEHERGTSPLMVDGTMRMITVRQHHPTTSLRTLVAAAGHRSLGGGSG
jgi:hypothetical protein